MHGRGAGASKGRASWTGKPEPVDYLSFAGFFIHYMLECLEPRNIRTQSADNGKLLQMIFGGYSYGSIIASQMPAADEILRDFSDRKDGSIKADIVA